jgi:DEAD/DEAH box helicase domain-containing protein
LHTYRGVFGSHLANVLRRLQRIARFYGSNPQFICCTATIANPGELASQLIEQEIEVVEENGAPSGEKLFVFYNPPMIDRNLGIRRSYVKEATRLTNELLARKLQTIVFANSRLQTEVILTYLQQRTNPSPGRPNRFAATAVAICHANGARSNMGCGKGAFAGSSRPARWSWESTSARSTPA